MEAQYKKIIVGYDESAASEAALEKAIVIAKKFNSEIHIAHVEGSGPKLDWDKTHARLNELRESTRLTFHIHHQKGRAYKEIVAVEKAIGGDLIVIGSHSHSGYMPMWLGSTAFRVVSASKSPVITVQETARNLDFKNLIVPLVDSPESRQKLSHAALFANTFGSTMHIIGLSKAKDAETEHHLIIYTKQAVEYCKSRNLPYSYEVVTGVNIAQTVIDHAQAKNGGLIFMMTETESAGLFMGTVAQQLINHSPYPVMSIHNKHVEGSATGGY